MTRFFVSALTQQRQPLKGINLPYARRASFVVLIIMSLLLSSCATIFKGGEQNIAFNSNPQGAEILIDGEPFGTTPQIIRLEVQRSYEVTLRQGSEERTITIRNRVGTQWVVLDVLGLLIPLLVDASTGDWYELSPDEVVVDFTEEGMTGHDSGE